MQFAASASPARTLSQIGTRLLTLASAADGLITLERTRPNWLFNRPKETVLRHVHLGAKDTGRVIVQVVDLKPAQQTDVVAAAAPDAAAIEV